jgi:hypothetical protein
VSTRVHLTLSRSLLSDPVMLQREADRIIEAAGMTEINEQRLSRYAILSGLVQDNKLQELEKISNVSVEIDSIKQIVS